MGQLGDMSPEASVAIGIIVGVLSTSIQSLGLTLQRQSHLLEDEKIAPEERRPPYKRPRWQLGMAMFVISNIVGSTIQITTLPLPVLSTLQASGLVFNTAFATLLLKEPFTKFSAAGMVLTCVGAALIAVFGAIGEPAHSLRQLLDLLAKQGFIIWMVGTLLVVAATIVFAHVLKLYSSHKHLSKHLQKADRSRSNSRADINSVPRARRMSLTAQLPRTLQLRVTRLRLVRGLSYALVSGILSAHSLLVAKSAVELLVRTIVHHDNQFSNFQSWLILLALVFFALSQLYYLHLGLRLCSTSVLYPFVFCIYNIVAILDGLIYFRQASRLSALHGGLIAVGTVILLSGVLALSWRLDDTTPAEPAPQVVDPQTPLVPGMGLIRSPEDGETSPLLPVARNNTSLSARSDERTPLLNRTARRTTLTRSSISPGGATTRDIWAELDDEDDDYNIFKSFPRIASATILRDSLDLPKKQRRASLPTKDDYSPHSSSREQSQTRKKRSQTLSTYRRESADRAAAMLHNPLLSALSNSKGNSSQPRKVSRDRRATVRFEEQNLRDTSPRRGPGLGLGSGSGLALSFNADRNKMESTGDDGDHSVRKKAGNDNTREDDHG